MMATFDATKDFQAASNPGGVWSFGYSVAGGAEYSMIPFDNAHPGVQLSWTRRDYVTSGTPAIWRNLGVAPTNGVGVGQLSLHPGPRPNGDFAILRFNAPAAGTYSVVGKFFAGDGGRMNARIIANNEFDRPLQVFDVTADDSIVKIQPQRLKAGDTLDFLVGNNGDFAFGNTPLQITISDIATGGIALVLSGGGARGSFQLGAIRYLYEKGKTPSILCGTSVGAINAIKLAEGENPANPKQGLAGLRTLWQSLKTNDDMYLAEGWLFDPDMDADLSKALRGQATLSVNPPDHLGPAQGDLLGAFYNFFSDAAFLVGPGQALLKSLSVMLTKARGLYNLSPIARKLATDCDPALIRHWADQGNRLRLAAVALDSGRLRYVTEAAQLIERDGSPVTDASAVAPACTNLAQTLNGAVASIQQLRLEVRDLQQQLQTAATGEKSALTAQIRGLNAQIAAGLLQVDIRRAALAECTNRNPRDFVLPDIRDGALASSSIPGIFLPIKIGEEYYVDGGVREVAPIQAAVDLGATTVYAVHASSKFLPASVTPAQAGVLDIVTRSLVDIAIDEIDRSDRLLVRDANAAAATIVHIEPLVDLHSITTIDPGLIQISQDYGYMRAADALDGAFGRRDELSTKIAQKRLDIWALENNAAGQPDPMHPGQPPSPPDAAAAAQVAADKAQLKGLIDERRAAGGPMPPDIDRWPVQPELHPWLGTLLNEAVFVSQVVPASIPAGTNARASITMRNTGTTTWQSAKGFALGAINPQDNTVWGVMRWELPQDVPPNAQVVFTRLIPAPPAAGADFQWRMVQDGVGWFGAPTSSVRVVVGATTEPTVCAGLRTKMAGISAQIAELTDQLGDDQRANARIKAAISALKGSLTKLRNNAKDSGCSLP